MELKDPNPGDDGSSSHNSRNRGELLFNLREKRGRWFRARLLSIARR